jgi:hypothetical protein
MDNIKYVTTSFYYTEQFSVSGHEAALWGTQVICFPRFMWTETYDLTAQRQQQGTRNYQCSSQPWSQPPLIFTTEPIIRHHPSSSKRLFPIKTLYAFISVSPVFYLLLVYLMTLSAAYFPVTSNDPYLRLPGSNILSSYIHQVPSHIIS